MLFLDINECEVGTDNCHADATCENTIGSFTCTCNTGYEGDGVTCEGTWLFFFGGKLMKIVKSDESVCKPWCIFEEVLFWSQLWFLWS